MNQFISGPAGKIETLAEGFDKPAIKAIAIVCHPHPLHGGTMDNKVVNYIARSFREMEMASIRFNFRGVSQSAGEYADGVGETDDLLAVIHCLNTHYPKVPLWLAGFSFGAYVALRAASQTNITRLVTVAPAVHLYDFSALTMPNCPWLLIQGDSDEIVSYDDVVNWRKTLEKPPRAIYLKGVSHFFHGQLVMLKDVLIGALKPAAEKMELIHHQNQAKKPIR